MVNVEQIIEFVDRVTEAFRPDQVILFGSYAYGTPTTDSDVDLLVVMPHEDAPYKKAAQITNTVPPDFDCDMMVRSKEALAERIALNDFFLKEVTEKGIALYDASNAGVGRKGRRRLQQRRSRTAVA